jgi:sugar transferase EpsL
MTEPTCPLCLEKAPTNNGVRIPELPQIGWRLAVKVLMDRVVAALALLLLSPFLLLVALLVALFLGRPVLFKQQRPGRFARPFTVIKFRTMSDRKDAEGTLLPDSERLTRFGSFIRSASIDELLQLWNVLSGDLSLVGPRPLLMRYLPRYSAEQAQRHNVLPGITGWAQVHGRNGLTWEEKFKLDLWYVDNWSLTLDCKILWMTLLKVFRREGISRAGHATMPEYQGSSESLITQK